MTRLLQLCKHAAHPVVLAGVLCGSLFSHTALSQPYSGQAPRIIASQQLGDSIGITYIDLQTRQSMPERLVYNPVKKDVQMVWMADVEWETSKSVRGSYLGVIDVSGEIPKVVDLPTGWQRIETGRSGWPSIAAFTDGSVGVAAHAPLLFSKNLAAAYTAFTTTQQSLGATVYFRSAVDGSDNVHLIFAYNSGAEAGQLGYLRSTDKGATWSAPILLTGATAPGGEVPGIAEFDSYAIAASGSKIVIVYTDSQRRLWKRESATSGETWQTPVVLHEPQYTYKITGVVEGNTVTFISDTVETAGSQVDVILDKQGAAHIVFAVLPTYISGLGTDNSGTLQRVGTDTLYTDRVLMRQWGLAYLKDGVSNIEHMAPPAGGEWNGQGRFVANSATGSGAGYSCYPQLGIDGSGTVYCVYTSVQNGDFRQTTITEGGVPTTVDALFGHIYATHKPIGHEWSEPLNLTPSGMDCLYGTLANTVDDRMYIGYQSDATPGIRVLHQTPLEASVVRFRALPVDDLNEAPAVSVPSMPRKTSELSIQIFPNPVEDNSYIRFDIDIPTTVSIDLYTAAGAYVATIFQGTLGKGQHSIPFGQDRIRELASGQYHCIVRTPSLTKSGLLSIVR